MSDEINNKPHAQAKERARRKPGLAEANAFGEEFTQLVDRGVRPSLGTCLNLMINKFGPMGVLHSDAFTLIVHVPVAKDDSIMMVCGAIPAPHVPDTLEGLDKLKETLNRQATHPAKPG